MVTDKLKQYVLNDKHDLKTRVFVLMSTVMFFSWGFTLIETIITGRPLMHILLMAAAVTVFAAVCILSIRFSHIRLGAVLVAFGLCLIFTPMKFFLDGGIIGDAPLWFLFAFFYINICLQGKSRVAFLLMECAAASGCWLISYRKPELIIENPVPQALIDTIISLLLIGFSISVIIEFITLHNKREMERSLAQKKEIEALNQAQNHFFSSMSHEIRTPINTIVALNEMILRENISDEVAEDAANIQSASKMLLHLINDILDMSKFASGQMKLTPVVYNPSDMLSEIVGMLWIRAKEKKLDFQVNVSPDIPAELLGDEVRIKQILINVLNNAIKYTQQGSVSLSIQSGETENGIMNVIYSVSDTGIGIKKENIPYLFNAFRRVDEENNRHIEGTGLGLSIVKQFVDLMGGKITVNSIYTKGSTFLIEIPQKIVGEQKIGEITIDNIDNMHSDNSRREHFTGFEAPEAQVLVVDDNASNLLVVKKLLRASKVQTETVSSGEEALRHTLNKHYHVIFMDHLMPHMDGIECLNAIRTQVGGQCRESKIIVLTANAGSENKVLYEKAGFDGYLTKPITGTLLEQELYRMLPKDLTVVTGNSDDILKETISWMKKEEQKKTVAITTESIADLPSEIIRRFGIAVLPHLVCTAEGNFMDGVEVETKGLMEYMKDRSRKVITRSPDAQTVEAFFAKQLTKANNIIHISISAKITNSGCPIAKEAAKAFDNVTVIDSGHLSSGQGLMVIEACRLAEEGKSPEEITAHLEYLKAKIRTSFVVDSLDFMVRAEQVSEKIANVTKSLMMKPVIVLRHGKIIVRKVFLGSRERVWRRYIRYSLRDASSIDKRILFVTYVGLSKRDMEWIRKQTEKYAKFEKIYFQKASPAIAVNSGNGTFGLLTMEKEQYSL